MYLIPPETENISLEDIELHFSDNSKKITDHEICKARQRTIAEDIENSIKKTKMECTRLWSNVDKLKKNDWLWFLLGFAGFPCNDVVLFVYKILTRFRVFEENPIG